MLLISISSYSFFFNNIVLAIVMLTFFHSLTCTYDSYGRVHSINKSGYFFLFFVVFYVGLRPINGAFIDMTTYASIFEGVSSGELVDPTGDHGFNLFIQGATKLLNAEGFFLLCAILYIYPMFVLSKEFFNRYWFLGFLTLVTSFSFWAYGTNGIRNGLATSIYLLALATNKKTFICFSLIIISCLFHKSMVIPSLAFALTYYFNYVKSYLFLWGLAIPVSLFSGDYFSTLIADIGFEDDRLGYLISNANAEEFSRTGFRWDFLVYSSIPVFIGYYFIFIKGFKDLIYNQIYSIYLISNSFWILVINANFSNRFAYLSWFLLPIIIIYPLLKCNIWCNQYRKVSGLIVLHFLFTYIMTLK